MSFFPSTTKSVKSLSLIPKCGLCGLYKKCKSPKMPYSGKGMKEVLIVGEAPGEDEDSRGRQFVGKTGQYLEKCLRKLGVEMRDDCWLTNSIICHPKKNLLPEASIDYCRPTLLKTLEELQPKVVILLGGSAVRSLIGHVWHSDTGGVYRWVGWKIPCHKPNAWLCPTWHPSYLTREENPVLERFFLTHLENAFKRKERPWETPIDFRDRCDVVLSAEEASERIHRILISDTGRAIAFDYETNCLKPDSDKAEIISCSVSDGLTTFAYPWYGRAIKASKELIFSDIPKIGANLKFEERWTRSKLGRRVKNWFWDTVLAAHVLDNRPRTSSLKFQAFVRLGMPDYDSHLKGYLQADGGNVLNRIREIELKSLLLYNALDSLLEWEVCQSQRREMGYE